MSAPAHDDPTTLLMSLFVSNEDYCGTHGEPDWDEEKGKWGIQRTAKTLRDKVSPEHWRLHLAGTRPLGIIPIMSDSRCVWGCVDIDDYKADLAAVVGRVETSKLPLVPCRSKSGGLHLFLFLSVAEPAKQVQARLRDVAASLGHAGAEIFPKQTNLDAERGDKGNWIVMPYFGALGPPGAGTYGGKLREQWGLKRGGAEMMLGEFVRAAEAARCALRDVRVRRLSVVSTNPGSAAAEPFSDGPPCLEHLAITKVPRGGQNMKLEEFSLELLGFDDSELASILNSRSVGATDPNDVPLVPVNPVTRPGDLWHMGRHLLLCGDATERGDVEFLLAGAQPHLMVTDPPYGVEYDPDWRNRADRKSGRPIGARATGRPVNDHQSDWSAAWALFPGDVVYQWHAGLHASDTQHALEEAGFEIRAQIIWAKQQFVIGRGHYHVQHEPCWYAVRKGFSGHWSGDRSQSTIWNIDKPVKSETGHSTQKPVECMLRPIENNSQPGDAVYDPFVGSGTTIIAAEMTGRCCHAIEISPAYCDVAILRWQDFTQEKATLDGRTFDEVKDARCDPNRERAESGQITGETVPPREERMADGGTIR